MRTLLTKVVIMSIRFIRDAYRLLAGSDITSAAERKEKSERQTGRAIAKRFSRGNVAMQHGSFVTTGDLERERREVAKLVFRN